MKSEKIERILLAACKLFAEQDYQRVSMEDVAVAAEVGKGTLYNYFQSKDDLYFSILQSRLKKLLGILEKAYSNRNDFIRNLRSLILHLNKFMVNHPHFHKIWNREENNLERKNNHDILDLRNKILGLIKRVLLQGEKEKLLKTDLDIDISGQLIYSMINHLKISKTNAHRKEPQIDSFMKILLTGIGIEKIDPVVSYKEYKHDVK